MIFSNKQDRVSINVSGSIFETLEMTLSRYPETLLGDKKKRKQYLCRGSKQLFFNRNRVSFDAILFFYQSHGKLVCPPDISVPVFVEECKFFQLSTAVIKKMSEREGFLQMELPAPSLTNRHRVWNALENPETSTTAMCFALFSFFMITVSIASTCLETLISPRDSPHAWRVWKRIEMALSVWFLVELLMRMISCPNKLKFLMQSLNLIDIVIVVPYFISIALGKNLSTFSFLRILRFARVIRLFRLSKHSKRLKVAGMIIKSSLGDLRLFFFCLMILNVIGASLMYHLEGHYDGTSFHSIPDALWWAIQTVVTLGYGDVTPGTVLGKCFAACYMTFGALTMSLPVLAIVARFAHMYEKNIK